MEQGKKIPDIVIKRLPVYYRFLTNLHQMGISRVSSTDLGKKMGITSSQVRQDFFNFGSFGLQGYGYDVDQLRTEIGSILGLDTMRTMIIIGAGHLGQALARHSAFEKDGFSVIGVFDINPHLIGEKIRDVEIMHVNKIAEFVASNKVDIAVITVPRTYAKEVADMVIGLGIRGIWNFTSVKLTLPDNVAVENIHLSDSLMTLGYYMKEMENRKK
ncbi:MAG: redox-sensing transcriptional repressor Rex [Clostridiales bacterium]|jgi:redox-sensing transcriptional repressor|nr:redox-sensing transcriptional repressor Rex [Clostridiales bacterium]